MSREELLSEMVASLRDQVEWQTKSAILAERERAQIRELLVEAMVEECAKHRCYISWMIKEQREDGVEFPIEFFHRKFWSPWFDAAARVIFQMRRGE